MKHLFTILTLLCSLFCFSLQKEVNAAVPLIFDTDMGNDVDDAMALAIIHAFIDRNEVDLLAVTLTKTSPNAAPYIQLFNSTYGHPDIPIGIASKPLTPEDGNYLAKIFELKDENGNQLFERPEVNVLPAVTLLRQKLAEASDNSVVVVQVGFSSNLAELLDSPADEYSPLTGKELIAQKVKILSTMFGVFNGKTPFKEYNVVNDIPAAQKLVQEWPTPIWFSGSEIGSSILISQEQMDNTFRNKPNHLLPLSFINYHNGNRISQATFDLTSVLLPLRLNDGYFHLSAMGTVSVDDEGISSFTEDPNGIHQFIKDVTPEQNVRIQEAFLYLMSQPPVK